MASSSSSSNTYQNNQRSNLEITQEELVAFYNVDRQLFGRLVFGLGLDPSQAIQASGFWLWLEKLYMAQYVATIVKYPDNVLKALFEETLLCLRVGESEEMVINPNIDVPMVQRIVGVHRKGVNLKFFKENRILMLHGVGNMINHICLKAFKDLIQIIMASKEANNNMNNNNNNNDDDNDNDNDNIQTDRNNDFKEFFPFQFRSSVRSSPNISVTGGNFSTQIWGGSHNVGDHLSAKSGVGVIGDGLGGRISGTSASFGVIGDGIGSRISGATSSFGVIGDGIGSRISSPTSSFGVIGDGIGVRISSPSSSFCVIGDGLGDQISDNPRETLMRQSPIVPPPRAISPIYEQNLRDENKGVFVYYPQLKVGDFNVPLRSHHFNVSNTNFLQGGGTSLSNNVPMPLINVVGNSFAVETQPKILQADIIEQLLAQMHLEEVINVPTSERSIFLTFSKGYPIHENELREFFYRSFGDIIEALYMQEVGVNEQPLYARLVVRDVNSMAAVLSEYGKSKFSINGKHVWARKYVRKINVNSPPNSPSTN